MTKRVEDDPDEEEEVVEKVGGVSPPADDEDEAESSLEELIARRSAVPAEEEESLLELTPDEHVEALSVRAAPKQANEFVCSNCRLVKHNSQLADRKRQLCRDCV